MCSSWDADLIIIMTRIVSSFVSHLILTKLSLLHDNNVSLVFGFMMCYFTCCIILAKQIAFKDSQDTVYPYLLKVGLRKSSFEV